MQLSHETLAECVTVLRRDSRDRLGHERRVLPRFRVWAPLTIHWMPDEGQRPFTAWSRDVSRGGIGLMHTTPMAFGTQFSVTLGRLEGDALHVLCSVVYCAETLPQMYSIGAKFVRLLDTGEKG